MTSEPIDNAAFINNFISKSPIPTDYTTTSLNSKPSSNSSTTSYLSNLNDSGINSNPSSVDSAFSSKQSNISDSSSSFDEQLNEFDSYSTSTNYLESNIKALTIQETNNEQLICDENASLNVFICWMDKDESQLSEEFEIEMREILKQQSALNLYDYAAPKKQQ